MDLPHESEAPEAKWATTFRDALQLIGKSKDAVVAKFGVPDSASSARYDYDAKFRPDNYAMWLYFNQNDKKLELVDIRPETKSPAGSLWQIVAGAGSEPQYYQAVDRLMIDYWKNGNGAVPSDYSGMLISINGTVGGQPIQLNASSAQPPMMADRVFDTKTDSYTVGRLKPNPRFNWRDAKVFEIESGKHNTCYTG